MSANSNVAARLYTIRLSRVKLVLLLPTQLLRAVTGTSETLKTRLNQGSQNEAQLRTSSHSVWSQVGKHGGTSVFSEAVQTRHIFTHYMMFYC